MPEPKPRRQRKKKTATTEAAFEYEQVVDKTDPDEIKLHKREVHHIPPEILDRVFNKPQGPRPGHPHANAQQPPPQEDAKSLISLKKKPQ
jgi:hypothetical protein